LTARTISEIMPLMFRQLFAKFRRKQAVEPILSRIEVRTDEVLEVRLSRPLSIAPGSVIECLPPSVARNAEFSVRPRERKEE
jgi:hypothetical protein